MSDQIAVIIYGVSQRINISNPDFLRTWDKTDSEIKKILSLAGKIRKSFYSGKAKKIFNSGLAISIFHDKSTRTRYSYAAACDLLGLSVNELDETKSQITHGETVMETVNMLSFLTRAIGIRDDIYLGVGQDYMGKVAEAADWGYANKILKYRPTIVNLQSDEDHPTQSMADLLHLAEHFGGLSKLRGKKVAVTWAYSPSYGKPMSVPQGAIALLSRFGMNISLAYPLGYHLIPEVEKLASVNAKKSGGSFKIVKTMEKAFKGADIVYPKSWASFSVMQERSKLFNKQDEKGLARLEKDALKQNANYQNWTCTEQLINQAKRSKTLYMHCLPADITGVNCKKGEVTKEVFEKYKKETYLQASWKPFAIAAMIAYGQGYTSKT